MGKDSASPAIEKEFKVVGVVPGEIVIPEYGTVDLRCISLEQAIELEKRNFPYLKRIKKSA